MKTEHMHQLPADVTLEGKELSLAQVLAVARHHASVALGHDAIPRVQDPYTLRCAPQVFGAVRDALEYCASIFERELSAVTDNPLVFPDDGAVLSGGNCQGQQLRST